MDRLKSRDDELKKYTDGNKKSPRKKHKNNKRKIPATVRNIVWEKYIRSKNNSKCYCCNIEPITKGNFECGHIVSDENNGKITINNLRPICSLCNKSMGAMNMNEFMTKYGFDENIKC